MTPANIVGMAMIKGLDLIAVTDHNSCKNCPAVLTMAEAYGLTALPGNGADHFRGSTCGMSLC